MNPASPKTRLGLRKLTAALPGKAPLLLFVAALALLIFAVGVYVGLHKAFPYSLVVAARKTANTLIETRADDDHISGFLRFTDIAPDQAQARRMAFIGADRLAGPALFLSQWGMEKFDERCPDAAGCLAVEYSGAGELRHAYPYRPEAIETAPRVVDLPYEQSPGFSFRTDRHPAGLSRYANGDLLVTFHLKHSFPFAGGVARIDRQGRPLWFRQDYSHHQPHVNADSTALAPGLRIGGGPVAITLKEAAPHRKAAQFKLACESPNRDLARVIDGEGRALEEIDLLEALLESPYAAALRHTRSPCDPLHLNSVEPLDADARGAGLAPGDLVASLRNLSAFAIIDRDSRRLKRLVRGGFFMQHSVKHLEGAKFLMFDNWGADEAQGPSRLLMVDLAAGSETTIFPNAATPEPLRNLFSIYRGHLSISPDRRRALCTFSDEGKSVEVRLADGAALAVFTNLRDISRWEPFSEERKHRAALFKLQGAYYLQ